MALLGGVDASGVVGGGFVDEYVAVEGVLGEVGGVRGVSEVDQFAALERWAGEFGLGWVGEGLIKWGREAWGEGVRKVQTKRSTIATNNHPIQIISPLHIPSPM